MSHLPVLAEQEGRQGGDHCGHTAIEGQPRALHQEPHQNEDATDGVADKHHLGHASKYPVNELEHHRFVWKTQEGWRQESQLQAIYFPCPGFTLNKTTNLSLNQGQIIFIPLKLLSDPMPSLKTSSSKNVSLCVTQRTSS